MKKNEHYFPTVEYVKDSSEPEGWKVAELRGGSVRVSGGVMDEGTIVGTKPVDGDVDI